MTYYNIKRHGSMTCGVALWFGQSVDAFFSANHIRLCYLSSRQDWELRLVFCRKIPAVCAFLGSTVTSECILPFLENALVDNEERVVAQSVRCITTLVQLKLLSRLMTVDAVRSGAPLLLHPRPTIRQAAIALVEAAASALESTDAAVFLLPLLRPALTYNLSGMRLTAGSISRALMEPLSWKAYRRTLGERLAALSSPHSSRSLEEGGSMGRPSLLPSASQGEQAMALMERADRISQAKRGCTGLLDAPISDSWIVSSSPLGVDADGFDEDQNEFEASQWGGGTKPKSAFSTSPANRREREKEHTEQTFDPVAQVTAPFEDASEPAKLQYMLGYVDLVAKECLSRASQGHSQGPWSVSGHTPRQTEGCDEDIIRTRASSLSQGLFQATHTPSLAATGLSEGLTHSLLVPHQKYGNSPAVAATFSSAVLPPSSPVQTASSLLCLSESDKEMALKITTLPNSAISIGRGLKRATVYSIFGIQSGDMVRNESSHALGNFPRSRSGSSLSSSPRQLSLPVPTPPLHSSSPGLNKAPAEAAAALPAQSSSSSSSSAGLREDQDKDREISAGSQSRAHPSQLRAEEGIGCDDIRTLQLVNRLRALQIPPLPPDLGSLQHANGKPYR
jgi:hypothetical protein